MIVVLLIRFMQNKRELIARCALSILFFTTVFPYNRFSIIT